MNHKYLGIRNAVRGTLFFNITKATNPAVTITTASLYTIADDTSPSVDIVNNKLPASAETGTHDLPVSSDAITDESAVSSDAITDESPVSSDAITDESPVSSDATTDESPVSSDATTDESAVSSDATTDESAVSSDATTDESPVSSDAITDEPRVSSDVNPNNDDLQSKIKCGQKKLFKLFQHGYSLNFIVDNRLSMSTPFDDKKKYKQSASYVKSNKFRFIDEAQERLHLMIHCVARIPAIEIYVRRIDGHFIKLKRKTTEANFTDFEQRAHAKINDFFATLTFIKAERPVYKDEKNTYSDAFITSVGLYEAIHNGFNMPKKISHYLLTDANIVNSRQLVHLIIERDEPYYHTLTLVDCSESHENTAWIMTLMSMLNTARKPLYFDNAGDFDHACEYLYKGKEQDLDKETQESIKHVWILKHILGAHNPEGGYEALFANDNACLQSKAALQGRKNVSEKNNVTSAHRLMAPPRQTHNTISESPLSSAHAHNKK